jgi:hypothetical protein
VEPVRDCQATLRVMMSAFPHEVGGSYIPRGLHIAIDILDVDQSATRVFGCSVG